MFGTKFVGRQLSFISAGIVDRISSRIFKREVSFGKMCVIKLNDCEPWTDHFSARTVSDIKHALLNKDFSSARALIALCSNEDASRYCIALLEKVVDLLASGYEVEVELITFLE